MKKNKKEKKENVAKNEIMERISRKFIITLVLLILLLCGAVGGAFYIFYNQPDDYEDRDMHGGGLELTYSDDANLFMIEKCIPTSDATGMAFDSADMFYDFTVKTSLDEANSIDYDIILVKSDSLSSILEKNIKVYLAKEKDGKYIKVAGPVVFESNVTSDEFNSGMKIYTGTREKGGNDNYRLRMWASDTAQLGDDDKKSFAIKIALVGKAE